MIYTDIIPSINPCLHYQMPWRYLLSSTHLTKPWLSGIVWRSSRSNADISIGIHRWNKLVKSTAESELGPLGQCCCGESLSVNIQEMLSPSSSDHRQVCGSAIPQWPWWPWRKSFVCLGRGKASSSIKWHSSSRRLNAITQFLSSGNLFWDFFLPESQSKTLHNCMFSSSWFHLCLEKTVIKS